MTTYDASVVADSEIQADKPIKQRQGRQLRDNLLAVIEGDVSAPGIERKAIKAGGSGIDGAWINATVVSGLGYFEPLSILFTAARSLPGVVIARVSGDVTISDIVTLDGLTAANLISAEKFLRAKLGINGADVTGTPPGPAPAAANIGASGAGLAGVVASTLRWPWLGLIPILGGKGGDSYDGTFTTLEATGGNAGGSLILLVEGNVDCTGGTIRANGSNGVVGSPSTYKSGPGSGGSIVIAATGTITGGTYEAKGGNHAAGGSGDGAGGGFVSLIASAFAGSRTKTVTGGTGGSSNDVAAGYSEEITLTAQQIRALLFRSY